MTQKPHTVRDLRCGHPYYIAYKYIIQGEFLELGFSKSIKVLGSMFLHILKS